MNVYAGEPFNITSKITPFTATNLDVIWSLPYPDTATISHSGIVKTDKNEVTITVTPIKNNIYTNTLQIKVETVDGGKTKYCITNVVNR